MTANFIATENHVPCSGVFCALGLEANAETLAKLEHLMVQKNYGSGETIFWEDDPADSFYLLKRGAVKGYKLLPNGRSQIARIVVLGDLMAYSCFETHTYTAEALVDCEVFCFQRARFEAIVEQDPKLRQALAKKIAEELHQTQKQILLLGRMPAAERVSQFLLDFATRLEGETLLTKGQKLIELPMTRADIADYLGLTIETVSRIFSKFRKDGLIELPKPNVVRFCDPTRFQRQAQALAA